MTFLRHCTRECAVFYRSSAESTLSDVNAAATFADLIVLYRLTSLRKDIGITEDGIGKPGTRRHRTVVGNSIQTM